MPSLRMAGLQRIFLPCMISVPHAASLLSKASSHAALFPSIYLSIEPPGFYRFLYLPVSPRHPVIFSRLIESVFSLPAPRTFPVIRQVFKCRSVMFSRVIYIAADGTDIFPGSCRRFNLTDGDRLRHVVQIYDFSVFQVS